MKELGAVLASFTEAMQCGAVVWTRAAADAPIVPAVGAATGEPPAVMELMQPRGAPVEVHTRQGSIIIALLPGPRPAWLAVGPCRNGGKPPGEYLKFLLPIVTHYVRASLEVEHAANELAERYEEINLLYTTSEILGRTVALEDAARLILIEISETVGALRAAILAHDRVTGTLQVVAALGFDAAAAPPIAVDDPESLSARVFTTRRSLIVDPDDFTGSDESLYRAGSTLCVPIMWTTPDGGHPLGVVHLTERRSGQAWTAGDTKLVEAIATQIGTAIQNARLVRESLSQQRLANEMSMANDLQMKLLPDPSVVAPEATVAARVVPADSVGGDFYHLFRLGQARTGVLIGDVSSHGYRSALIMALAMSAAAIHAQSTHDASETLSALLASLRDELSSTEMFITVFYGIIDRRAGLLRYANMGHPHAFQIADDGTVERLAALDPPLGMVTHRPDGAARPWRANADLLLLFTDGLSDARNRAGTRLGEARVLETVVRHRLERPEAIRERVFEVLEAHVGDVPRRDDLAIVIVRS